MILPVTPDQVLSDGEDENPAPCPSRVAAALVQGLPYRRLWPRGQPAPNPRVMESDPVKLKYPIAALAAALSLSGPAAGLAQDTAAPAPKVTAATPAPKLLVVIAVDQFSADLFAEYRGHFTGGLARLASGVVFPSGYKAHGATETCPGHSTNLTGNHPAQTGIADNNYFDIDAARAETRSDERRVGKDGVRTFRFRWSTYP